MPERHNQNQLAVFDDNIRERIAHFRTAERCRWCRSPIYPVKANGLCSSCYRWDKQKRDLEKRVVGLPDATIKDPFFTLRHDLDIARCAVELCEIDGKVLNERLGHAEPIELEHEFEALSVRTLGKKGARLFHGHARYFVDFSDAQRTWIWYLVSIITNEMNRRNRRKTARLRNIAAKNRAFEASYIGGSGSI